LKTKQKKKKKEKTRAWANVIGSAHLANSSAQPNTRKSGADTLGPAASLLGE
jgi:hypothetical protein